MRINWELIIWIFWGVWLFVEAAYMALVTITKKYQYSSKDLKVTIAFILLTVVWVIFNMFWS